MKKTWIFLVVVFMLVSGLNGKEINWDNGNRITLNRSDTATCQALNEGQIYAVIFYNASGADHNITVNLTTALSTTPIHIVIPGTTANEGMASIALVSGSDSDTVTASISQSGSVSGDTLEAWIASVQMPTNDSGLRNTHLEDDGKYYPINKYQRYYTVPASRWYRLTLNSNINQFICIQFIEAHAVIYILNPGPNASSLADDIIYPIGNVKENKDYQVTLPKSDQPQTIQNDVFGGGFQMVWMSVDSKQDSKMAKISLQKE